MFTIGTLSSLMFKRGLHVRVGTLSSNAEFGLCSDACTDLSVSIEFEFSYDADYKFELRRKVQLASNADFLFTVRRGCHLMFEREL